VSTGRLELAQRLPQREAEPPEAFRFTARARSALAYAISRCSSTSVRPRTRPLVQTGRVDAGQVLVPGTVTSV
jgi:hypothetical protein